MNLDTELDQVICTALTLQDDYARLSSSLRDQARGLPSCILGTLLDLQPSMEIQIPLLRRRILHQTLLDIYSALRIPQEVQISKIRHPHASEDSKGTLPTVIPHEPQVNTQQARGTKRPLCVEEQQGCKKPRTETDDCLPTASNKSRKRTVYNKEQTIFLQKQFDQNPYPDFVSRCRISQLTGIPEPRIQVWFQNRRARHLPRLSKAYCSNGIEASSAEGPQYFIYKNPQHSDMCSEAQNPPKMWQYPN